MNLPAFWEQYVLSAKSYVGVFCCEVSLLETLIGGTLACLGGVGGGSRVLVCILGFRGSRGCYLGLKAGWARLCRNAHGLGPERASKHVSLRNQPFVEPPGP